MSGSESSSRHSATRLRSPPEILVTSMSQGGSLSASEATSSLRSMSPPANSASSLACSSASFSKSASGSEYAA